MPPGCGDTSACAVAAAQVTPQQHCETGMGLPGRQGMERQGPGFCGSEGILTQIITTPRALMLLGGKAGEREKESVQSPGGQRGDLFSTSLIFLYH